MAQQVANIGERRPQEQQPPTSSSPPEAVGRRRPRSNDWALYAIGLGTICAICYFAEGILVVILVSVLLAFVLAPIADLLIKLRLPRWLAAAIAVMLLVAGTSALAYYGVNQMSSLIDDLPQYSGRVRAELTKISRRPTRSKR